MTVGEALRKARHRLCYEQRDVARRVGISAQYLCDMECDHRLVPDRMLRRLCCELGLSYAYMTALADRLPPALLVALQTQAVDPERFDAAWVAFAREVGVRAFLLSEQHEGGE